jgi:dTDP-L-rhamnose 4-epimerase
MSKKKLLITGGAGFIGSHLSDDLLTHGYSVRVLDSLSTRVHTTSTRPPWLHQDVELIVGDVRDGAVVERALEGIDAVVHLASAVGVGESMYEMERCTSVNNVGTAVLMDRLMRAPVERFVLASSMSVYGEGLYRSPDGMLVEVKRRSPAQLRRAEWEHQIEGRPMTPVPTPETKTIATGSVYARSKYDQERMCLRFGRAFGIATVALRFFNVFGPRQSSSDPYAGDLAVFVARLLSGRRPLVFEDGGQLRDYVHVRDVVTACRLALEADTLKGHTINVGSGEPHAIGAVARRIAELVGRPELEPERSGTYQMSEVRHCFADVTRAKELLGYRPAVALDTGLAELVRWVAGRTKRGEGAALDAAPTQLVLGLTP